jgi:hypothetical protein
MVEGEPVPSGIDALAQVGMCGANHGAEPVDECHDGGRLADEQLLELLVDGRGCWHGGSEAQGTDSSGGGSDRRRPGVTFRACTR